MSKVVLTLAATTVGLGLVCLHLVKQVREGDATIVELKTRVASLQEQVEAARTLTPPPASDVVNAIDGVLTPTEEAKTSADSLRDSRQVAAPPMAGGTTVMAAAPLAASLEDRIRMMREHRERQRQLMQDPEYREAVRLQARTSYARQYPGVIQELGFDQAQADDFFVMLAEQQMRANERMEALWEEIDPGDPAALQSRHQKLQAIAAETQRTNEAEIAARFGADKLQAWQEYRATLGQRWQLEHMRGTLASQGLPLSEEMHRPMLKALAEAQRLDTQQSVGNWSTTPAAARLVSSMTSEGALAGAFEVRDMEQQIEATRKRHQRMLDAISSYLTVEQRQALEREQEAQLKIQEAQLRLMRAQGTAAPGVFYPDGSVAIPVQASK